MNKKDIDIIYQLFIRLYRSVPDGTRKIDFFEASLLLVAFAIEQCDSSEWDDLFRRVSKVLPLEVRKIHQNRSESDKLPN